MVQLRTLTRDEVEQVFPGRRTLDLSEYTNALKQVDVGEAAEIDVDGLSQRALKRRVGQAAKQLGIAIKWARVEAADDDVLIFQVRAAKNGNGKPRAKRMVKG